MKLKAFIEHKMAEQYSDCQDFFCINAKELAVAVSDGMSQSIFPGWWAEELTTRFVTDKDWSATKEQICASQVEWRKRVDDFVKQKEIEGKDPWMLKNSLIEKKGAGATFCGIRFNGVEWNGFVLGDTCLIVVDNDNRIKELCTTNYVFGNRPDYFDSMGDKKGEIKHISGKLENGKLLLVTDPIAEFLWIKKTEGKESDFIRQLFALNSHEDFCALAERWRKDEHMHNDDSTVVCIESDLTENFQVVYQDSLEKLCELERKPTLIDDSKQKIIANELNYKDVFHEFIKKVWNILNSQGKPNKDKVKNITRLCKKYNDYL